MMAALKTNKQNVRLLEPRLFCVFIHIFPFSMKGPTLAPDLVCGTDVCGKKTAENRSGGENRIYVIFVRAQPTTKVELWNIPNVLWNKSVVFKKYWHTGRSLALSTHILEVKVKVPSEVAVEDSRITDGRHRGYCPDLDIVCSLVTTIYYPNYPQSRPNPGYIENRCGHLPPTATNVLPGSPHQPMLQNILQNNTAKPLLIIHEMSRVTRLSVTRHTSTLPRLMRSVMDWGPSVGLVNIIAWALSRAVSHYQHHLLPAHNLQWSLDLYEGWAIL